jgi:hypothetical protein
MADNLRQPQGNEFEQLLGKGLNLLQSPDAGGWTDHNLHDPGITVLEALAFAMSELQMKGETDMQDLYAPFIAAPGGTPLLHGKKPCSDRHSPVLIIASCFPELKTSGRLNLFRMYARQD